MSYENIIVETDEAIATVTLNRPAQRNALSRALREEFKHFLANLQEETKAVVVTGAGPVFCAGMDLKEPVGHNEGREQWAFFKQLFNCDTIFVASLNGPTVGAGNTLLAACDLAVAEPTANLALPQIRHGIYGGVAAGMLHLALPKKVIAEMALTGLPLPAERARELGLINAVAEEGQSLTMATTLAKRIAGFDRRVLNTAKHVIQNVPDNDADREAALKEVRLGQLLNFPITPDKVIDTEYGGNRKSD